MPTRQAKDAIHICSVLLLWMATISVAGAVNVTNHSLETGDYSGWAWTKAATVSTDYAHSGIYSSKLDNFAGPYDNISAYMEQYPVGGDWNANTITTGDILRLSAWVYNPSEDPLISGQGGYLRMYVVGDNSGIYAEASDFIIDSDIPQDEWTLVTHTMTVPEGDYHLVGISVMMFEFFELDGGVVYVDNIQLEKITTTTTTHPIRKIEFDFATWDIETVTFDSVKWNVATPYNVTFALEDAAGGQSIFVDDGVVPPANQTAAELLATDTQLDTGVSYTATANIGDAGLFHFNPPLIPGVGADVIVIKSTTQHIDDNIIVGVVDSSSGQIINSTVKKIQRGDANWYELNWATFNSFPINRGLETGDYTGWAWTKAATVSTDYAHGGIYSSKLDNFAGPYDNISAYMEQYPVGGDWNANTITAGDTLTLSAWVYNPSEDPLISGQGGYLRIYVAGDTSGTYAEASGFIIDPDIPHDEWTLVTHAMTVPEGDYHLVGISVTMVEFSELDGGAIYVDDVQVSVIKESDAVDRNLYAVTGIGANFGLSGPTTYEDVGLSAVAIGFDSNQSPIEDIRIGSDYASYIREVIVVPIIPSDSCQAGVFLRGDLNKDCYVNLSDMVLFAQEWQKEI